MIDLRRNFGTAFGGYTLVELLVVLLILGTVAAIAIPQVEPSTPFRVAAAAKDVAQAYRFAQGEAQRTGVYFLVRCDIPSNSISVNRVDMTASPPAADLAIPVLHPLDKRPYKISFSTGGTTSGVKITQCAFGYSDGKGSVSQVMFSNDGTPVNIVGNKQKDILDMTSNGLISVNAGRLTRTVQVGIVTGRVSILP